MVLSNCDLSGYVLAKQNITPFYTCLKALKCLDPIFLFFFLGDCSGVLLVLTSPILCDTLGSSYGSSLFFKLHLVYWISLSAR